MTPLLYAVQHKGASCVVKELIRKGADINIQAEASCKDRTSRDLLLSSSILSTHACDQERIKRECNDSDRRTG